MTNTNTSFDEITSSKLANDFIYTLAGMLRMFCIVLITCIFVVAVCVGTLSGFLAIFTLSFSAFLFAIACLMTCAFTAMILKYAFGLKIPGIGL